MLAQKRLLILLGFLALFFIFINNSSSAQESKIKQEIKKNQDKNEYGLKVRVAELEKEKNSLLRTLDERAKGAEELKEQIAQLKAQEQVAHNLDKKNEELAVILRDKEKQINQLQDRIAGLEKEKEEITKQDDILTKQIAVLKKKIDLIEKDRVILESMLSCQYRDLRPPDLVKKDEKNLDKAVHLNLGFAYGLKGKIKEAIKEYKKALKYAPQDKDIHYNLGYLLTKQNKCKEAIEEYKRALTGLSNDREVYYNLSLVCAVCLKDTNTADQYYNKFLKLTPLDRGNP